MRVTLLLLSGLVGCTDYTVQGNDKVNEGVDEGEPDIVVDPPSVDFGDVAVGTSDVPVETVTVSNVGDAALQISDLYLATSNTPFTFSAIGSVVVNPGESTTFTVSFEPWTAGEVNNQVVIQSNDPDTSALGVDLNGNGIAPAIELSPTPDSFGNPYIGCVNARPLTIKNIGNADLVVDGMEYTTASVDELWVDTDEPTNGPLPWTIAAGDSKIVYVDYEALDTLEDSGFITVSSNDPNQPEAKAEQSGNGVEAGDNEDVYEQPVRSAVDILWVVDNSGSMGEEQSSLATNAENFMSSMVSQDADYQIGVITTDQSDLRGDVITPDTADSVSEFVTQATPGTMGSGDEQGSEMAKRCLDEGDCIDSGLIREDARLDLIIVSDEVDSSSMSSGWTWADYLAFFQGLKSNPDDVVINAIAGDYPTGCTTADPGIGYYEQVAATGGLYLSICATDWADYLTTIGEEAAQQKSSFALTDEPVPETIVVVVDGITQYSGWAYDDTNNTVDFDDEHIPAGGATITIDYLLYGDCEE